MNLLVVIAGIVTTAVRAITVIEMIDVTAMTEGIVTTVGTATIATAISHVAAEQLLPNQNFLRVANR
jgi:hypothetical protein